MAAKKTNTDTAKQVAEKAQAANVINFDKKSLVAAIADKEILKPKEVPLDEVGGVLFVRRFTLGERDEYFAEMAKIDTTKDSGNAQAFARAAVNEDGSAMFDHNDAEDLDIIRSLPPAIVTAALDGFYEANGFQRVGGKSAQDKVKEDLKNS